ncbi:MAG: hypothetical protein ABI846_02315 [Rudaea sp.]
MNTQSNSWYRVPEVWLIVLLLGAMVVGSFALLVTAVRHPDRVLEAPRAIASPLPPSQAPRPADVTTP